ncbi:MAG: hypothetical protein U1U88_000840 [Lawsonella clevelandensis]
MGRRRFLWKSYVIIGGGGNAGGYPLPPVWKMSSPKVVYEVLGDPQNAHHNEDDDECEEHVGEDPHGDGWGFHFHHFAVYFFGLAGAGSHGKGEEDGQSSAEDEANEKDGGQVTKGF